MRRISGPASRTWRMSVAGDTPSRSRRSAAGKTPCLSSLAMSVSMKRLYTSHYATFILYFHIVHINSGTIIETIFEMILRTLRPSEPVALLGLKFGVAAHRHQSRFHHRIVRNLSCRLERGVRNRRRCTTALEADDVGHPLRHRFVDSRHSRTSSRARTATAIKSAPTSLRARLRIDSYSCRFIPTLFRGHKIVLDL
jgi:hypothetical protein